MANPSPCRGAPVAYDGVKMPYSVILVYVFLLWPTVARAHGPNFGAWPLLLLGIYIAALTWAFCGTLRLLPLDFKYREPIAYLTTVLSVFILMGCFALVGKFIAGITVVTILLWTVGIPLIIFAMPFFMAKIVKDW